MYKTTTATTHGEFRDVDDVIGILIYGKGFRTIDGGFAREIRKCQRVRTHGTGEINILKQVRRAAYLQIKRATTESNRRRGAAGYHGADAEAG